MKNLSLLGTELRLVSLAFYDSESIERFVSANANSKNSQDF